MPAVVVGAIISAAAGTGAVVYSTKAQNSAAKRAQRVTETAQDRATALEREALAEQKRQFDAQQSMLRERHEAEQAELARQARVEQERFDLTKAREDSILAEERARYAAKETRLAPYREAGALSVKDLAARAASPSPSAPIQGMKTPTGAVMNGMIQDRPSPVNVSMREMAGPPPSTLRPEDIAGMSPQQIAALTRLGYQPPGASRHA